MRERQKVLTGSDLSGLTRPPGLCVAMRVVRISGTASPYGPGKENCLLDSCAVVACRMELYDVESPEFVDNDADLHGTAVGGRAAD